MTTTQFFNGFISPIAHKIVHSVEEYDKIRKYDNVQMVKATTLYQIYKHNVFGRDERLSMREFFRVSGQYLYYDKYVCVHGTEFYYYVVFDEDDKIYEATKEIVDKRIEANSPSTLDDLLHVVLAVTKEE